MSIEEIDICPYKLNANRAQILQIEAGFTGFTRGTGEEGILHPENRSRIITIITISKIKNRFMHELLLS